MSITEKYLNKELSTSEQEEYNAWLDSLPEDEDRLKAYEKRVDHADWLRKAKREEELLKELK